MKRKTDTGSCTDLSEGIENGKPPRLAGPGGFQVYIEE